MYVHILHIHIYIYLRLVAEPEVLCDEFVRYIYI